MGPSVVTDAPLHSALDSFKIRQQMLGKKFRTVVLEIGSGRPLPPPLAATSWFDPHRSHHESDDAPGELSGRPWLAHWFTGGFLPAMLWRRHRHGNPSANRLDKAAGGDAPDATSVTLPDSLIFLLILLLYILLDWFILYLWHSFLIRRVFVRYPSPLHPATLCRSRTLTTKMILEDSLGFFGWMNETRGVINTQQRHLLPPPPRHCPIFYFLPPSSSFAYCCPLSATWPHSSGADPHKNKHFC